MGDELKIDDYKLSQELTGHSQDVRVVGTSNNLILSGSRDKTVRVWEKTENGTFKENETLSSHSNYVSSLCVFNDGNWIATGGNDKKIFVYNLDCVQPFATIEDHENTVCCLAKHFSNPKILISSSWDKTARIWTFSESNYTSVELKGHEQAVWTCASLKNGKFATGSADKNIFIWNSSGEKLVVLNGHTDCVRGLEAVNDGLLSCSNDATIRYWNLDTYECIREFHGHSNYIYSIAMLSDNVFITGSEDSTIRMWSLSGQSSLGALKLPVHSVWSVANFHGDIVAGSNDGLVRIFTKDKSRFAPENVLKAFDESIVTREAELSKEIGGVKVNDLPGPEALYQEGREGQTKMIRQPNGKVLCYQFTNGFWECVGDVMGATENSKTLLDGKEYDFVFNVDIEDGAPPLKLGFNKTEDPWFAAQKFIHQHDLPQVYLEQVANFIITNANLTTLPPQQNNPNFADPFTGGGRYIPTGNDSRPTNASTTDPFTGGGRYIPSGSQPSNINFREKSGSNGQSDELMIQRHIPSKTLMSFEVIVLQKVMMKVQEFNGQLESPHKMNDDDLKSALTIMDGNSAAIPHFTHMLNWPIEKLFPVLDIFRMAVKNESIFSSFDFSHSSIIDKTLKTAIVSLPANQLMGMRSLCNMQFHETGKLYVQQNLAEFIDCLEKVSNGNGNLQIAVSAFLYNTSITLECGSQESCISLVLGIVKSLEWIKEFEALFRLYQAVGNLMSYGNSEVVSLIKSIDVLKESLISNKSSPFEKLSEISSELMDKLV